MQIENYENSVTTKILIATTNPGKKAELAAMLDSHIEWLTLDDFPAVPDVPEDCETFEGNARKKALGYAKAVGIWTLADDSGLVIDWLDGRPGVRSARYSGAKPPEAERTLIDHRNIEKVLEEMQGVPEKQRTARFVCCICLAKPGGVLMESKGTVEGIITEEKIGNGGFGYDPIFFVPELRKTIAQLGIEHKNKISHRGRAIKALKPKLERLLT